MTTKTDSIKALKEAQHLQLEASRAELAATRQLAIEAMKARNEVPGEERMTLQEIADVLGVTRQRIHQLTTEWTQ